MFRLFLHNFLAVSYYLLLLPLMLYLTNSEEFSVGFLTWLKVLLPFFALILLASGALKLLPGKAADSLIALNIALMVCVYAQANLLVWDYGVFDGSAIEWGRFKLRSWIDSALWLCLLVSGLWWRHALAGRAVGIAALLCVFQIATIVPLLKAAPPDWFRGEKAAKLETFYRFSPQKNIVLIILDGFSAPVFDDVISESPALTEKLSGFTYYSDTISEFPSTLLSVPAILTGRPFDSTQILSDYFSRTFPENALSHRLKGAGWQTNLITLRQFCGFLHPADNCSGFTMSLRDQSSIAARKELLQLLEVTLFRVSPQLIKKLLFKDGQWLFSDSAALSTKSSTGKFDPHVSLIQNMEKYAYVKDGPPAFKFIHLIAPHFPIRLDEECRIFKRRSKITRRLYINQAKCALKLSTIVLDKMRSMGTYDNSLIMIFADHGTTLDSKLFDKAYMKAHGLAGITRFLPMLLIKPEGRNQPFSTDSTPVTLSDISSLVLALKEDPALSVSAVIPATRTRFARNIALRWAMWRQGAGASSYAGLPKYKVAGNARNMSSWELVQ